jgi:hypothetical protein
MSLLFDVNWNGGGNGQPVFSFGNTTGNSVYFTPSDENGKYALVMKNNGVEQRIVGADALPKNKWTKIAIYFGKGGTKLLVDNKSVGENKTIFIRNLTIGAGRFSNFLGRSQDGSTYFNGMIDNFEIYNTVNSITTGVSDLQKEASNFVKIYPNPVTENVQIEIKSEEKASITIIDVNGRKVFSSDFIGHIELSKSDFGVNGFYSVIVNEGGRKHTGKIIVN